MIAPANLDDLAAFAAVAEAQSFTRAARMLNTSTSNLSYTIKRLEARLGCRLLQRTSRSVSATTAGDMLLDTLKPALESIDAALNALEQERDRVSGTVRLTVTRQAYDAVVRPVLPAFLATYPAAAVEVVIDYAYRDIVADRFDAGIRLGEKIERDMMALKLGPDLSMAVVAAPELLARSDAIEHPSDLTRHRCINYRMIGAGTIYAWEFERDGKAFDVQVSGPLTFNEPQLMLDATLAGLGVGYLLSDEVAPYVADGQLIRLLADWTPPFPGFHLYYPSRRQMRPVLAAFIECIRSNLRRPN